MRNLYEIDRYRYKGKEIIKLWGDTGNNKSGMFHLPSPVDEHPIRVLASCGYDWDHVSASRIDRCPTWEEMEYVKKMFFRKNETVMQLHVPEEDHINCHPYCLHLWRPQFMEIPRPPSILVGPRG